MLTRRSETNEIAELQSIQDAIPVYIKSLIAGELQQFNRLAGGSIAQAYRMTASGIVGSGPMIFYGIKVITAGTAGTLTAYDASGVVVGQERTEAVPFGTATAGYRLEAAPSGVGVIFATGLYVAVPTGAVVIVLAAPGS